MKMFENKKVTNGHFFENYETSRLFTALYLASKGNKGLTQKGDNENLNKLVDFTENVYDALAFARKYYGNVIKIIADYLRYLTNSQLTETNFINPSVSQFRQLFSFDWLYNTDDTLRLTVRLLSKTDGPRTIMAFNNWNDTITTIDKITIEDVIIYQHDKMQVDNEFHEAHRKEISKQSAALAQIINNDSNKSCYMELVVKLAIYLELQNKKKKKKEQI